MITDGITPTQFGWVSPCIPGLSSGLMCYYTTVNCLPVKLPQEKECICFDVNFFVILGQIGVKMVCVSSRTTLLYRASMVVSLHSTLLYDCLVCV